MLTKIKFSAIMLLTVFCIAQSILFAENILTVEDDVINFTITYSSHPSITSSTTLSSIGIVSEQDTITYTMELEDNFHLTYQQGDASGLVTVGDAIALIQSKL